MTVYLDVIWMLNLLFDTLLLYLTGLLLGRTIQKRRLLLGGLIGSLIILLSVTEFTDFASHPIIKFIFSLIMVYAAFGFKRPRFFFTNLAVFYLCTFLIGGALIGVHYFIQFDLDLSQSIFLSSLYGFGDPISWIFVIIGFPLAWHFSKKTFDKWERATIQYDQLIDVQLKIQDEILKLKGLVDSGNQLYDPISKKPVMIVSLQKVLPYIPNELVEIFKDPDQMWNGSIDVPDQWIHRLSIVPYKVVGQNHQLMACLKFNEIVIEKENVQSIIKSVLVAFVNQKLSEDDLFECIVHPKMMTQHPSTKVS